MPADPEYQHTKGDAALHTYDSCRELDSEGKMKTIASPENKGEYY